MTRTVSLALIALLGAPVLAHAQTNAPPSGACGTESWSTDKMACVGVPCADVPARAPQQAAAPVTDTQYCGALVLTYDTFLNKGGKSGGMQSTNNAANVASAKCRAGDTSGIAELEKALKDARIDLPPRS